MPVMAANDVSKPSSVRRARAVTVTGIVTETRPRLTVTLPLTMPGILAGCVLVFVPSVGLFYLSDIMGGGLVLVGYLIRDQLLKVRDWNVGSAMSMVLIALSAGIYLLYRKVGGDDLGVM